VNVDLLSTISAHGRALKLQIITYCAFGIPRLSTISAHGRALKQGETRIFRGIFEIFQQFRLTVEH